METQNTGIIRLITNRRHLPSKEGEMRGLIRMKRGSIGLSNTIEHIVLTLQPKEQVNLAHHGDKTITVKSTHLLLAY